MTIEKWLLNVEIGAGIDSNGSLIARDKWKPSSDKWNLTQTCPTGQVIISVGYLIYM
jgi:hypothetical protein